jgi:hypothetical protein
MVDGHSLGTSYALDAPVCSSDGRFARHPRPKRESRPLSLRCAVFLSPSPLPPCLPPRPIRLVLGRAELEGKSRTTVFDTAKKSSLETFFVFWRGSPLPSSRAVHRSIPPPKTTRTALRQPRMGAPCPMNLPATPRGPSGAVIGYSARIQRK